MEKSASSGAPSPRARTGLPRSVLAVDEKQKRHAQSMLDEIHAQFSMS